MVCFSETRFSTRDELIEGTHRLIFSNDKNAKTQATDMTILVHRGMMAIDLNLSRRQVRILPVYVPNAWNYDLNYFQAIFDDKLSMEAMDQIYTLVIADDFIVSCENRDQRTNEFG